MLVAKNIQDARLDHKVPSINGRKLQPAGDQDAQHMTMGKEKGVILEGLQTGNHPVAAFRHLIRRLSPGSDACEDCPVRGPGANFRGCDSLIFSIVPFAQILRGLCPILKPSQLASALRPLAWATEDEFEIPVAQFRFQGCCLSLSLKRQGNIRKRGMPAIFAPFGFTVADKDNLGA